MINSNNNTDFWAQVDSLIGKNELSLALKLFDEEIASKKEYPEAELYYQRGRLLWKLGQKTDAMSDYAKAADIDAASPACRALEMAKNIMDFYNKDMYNP